jgi:hypothetical protein
MSSPSIRQQLQLLQYISPPVNKNEAVGMDLFLATAKARLTFRIDDAVNDTSLHVAAYGYDHEGVLALLVRDGSGIGGAGAGKMLDTPDSMGRTAQCPFSTEIYTRGCHWFPRLLA